MEEISLTDDGDDDDNEDDDNDDDFVIYISFNSISVKQQTNKQNKTKRKH